MFTELHERMADGDTITIAMTRTETGLSVTLLPSKKLEGLVPLSIKGIPQDLDEGFIQLITPTMTKVQNRLVVMNQEKVDKSIEEADTEDLKKPAVKKKNTLTKTDPPKAVAKKEEPKEDPVQVEIDKALKLGEAKEFNKAIEMLVKMQDKKIGTKEQQELIKTSLYNIRLAKATSASLFEDESSDIVIPQKPAKVAAVKIEPKPEPVPVMPEDIQDDNPIEEDFEPNEEGGGEDDEF